MAIRLHRSARTTPRIRAELQVATGFNQALAKLYGINVKTVAKWRRRASVEDQPLGPRDRRRRNLHPDQEQQAIELRRQGRLSLNGLVGHCWNKLPNSAAVRYIVVCSAMESAVCRQCRIVPSVRRNNPQLVSRFNYPVFPAGI